MQTTQDGTVGHIRVEALNKDNAFLNFLSIEGTVIGPDVKRRTVRLTQLSARVGERAQWYELPEEVAH